MLHVCNKQMLHNKFENIIKDTFEYKIGGKHKMHDKKCKFKPSNHKSLHNMSVNTTKNASKNYFLITCL